MGRRTILNVSRLETSTARPTRHIRREGVTVLSLVVAVHVLMAAVKPSKSQPESEKNPSYGCKTHQNVHDVTSIRMVLDDTSLGNGLG